MTEERFDRLEKKVDTIMVTLAEQGVVLAEHQRRSIANEKAVDILTAQSNKAIGAIIFVGGLGTIAAILDIALRMYGK